MNVTMQVVRMYGSKGHFGKLPRATPPGTPLVFADYPHVGDRFTIGLGGPIEEVFRGNAGRFAWGSLAMQAFGRAGPKNRMLRAMWSIGRRLEVRARGEDRTNKRRAYAAFRAALRRAPLVPDPNQYSWYITLIIEREISVAEDKVLDRPIGWLDWATVHPLGETFIQDSRPHLDLMATYASSVLDMQYFENLVINDRVYFSAPGRLPFGFPEFTGGGVGVVISGNPAPVQLLSAVMGKAASLPWSEHKWLANATRWYLLAVLEKDQTKQFLWGFLALELLTNELHGLNRPSQLKRLRAMGTAAVVAYPTLPVAQVVQGKRGLRFSFAVVAISLFPSNEGRIYADFETVRLARNSLAHGSIQDLTALPNGRLRTLLNELLQAARARYVL